MLPTRKVFADKLYFAVKLKFYSHTQNISRNFQMNKFVNFTLECSSDPLKINMFNPISEGEGSIIPPMEYRIWNPERYWLDLELDNELAV